MNEGKRLYLLWIALILQEWIYALICILLAVTHGASEMGVLERLTQWPGLSNPGTDFGPHLFATFMVTSLILSLPLLVLGPNWMKSSQDQAIVTRNFLIVHAICGLPSILGLVHFLMFGKFHWGGSLMLMSFLLRLKLRPPQV